MRFGGFILNKIQKTIYDFVADSPVERVIVQLNHKTVFEREFLNNDIDDVSRNHILSVVAREDVDWVVELFQAGDKIMIERLVYDNSFILILEKTMCEQALVLLFVKDLMIALLDTFSTERPLTSCRQVLQTFT